MAYAIPNRTKTLHVLETLAIGTIGAPVSSARRPIPRLACSETFPVRERPPSQWSEFRAALPPARALVPRFRAPQIAFVAIAAATLAVAALAPYLPRRHAAATVTPPAQIVPPIEAQEPPGPDLAAVKKAMSDCDAAAARDIRKGRPARTGLFVESEKGGAMPRPNG